MCASTLLKRSRCAPIASRTLAAPGEISPASASSRTWRRLRSKNPMWAHDDPSTAGWVSAVLHDLRVALVADRVRAADVDGVRVRLGEGEDLVAGGARGGEADLDEHEAALLGGGPALLEGPGAHDRGAALLARDRVPVDDVEAE